MKMPRQKEEKKCTKTENKARVHCISKKPRDYRSRVVEKIDKTQITNTLSHEGFGALSCKSTVFNMCSSVAEMTDDIYIHNTTPRAEAKSV